MLRQAASTGHSALAPLVYSAYINCSRRLYDHAIDDSVNDPEYCPIESPADFRGFDHIRVFGIEKILLDHTELTGKMQHYLSWLCRLSVRWFVAAVKRTYLLIRICFYLPFQFCFFMMLSSFCLLKSFLLFRSQIRKPGLQQVVSKKNLILAL